MDTYQKPLIYLYSEWTLKDGPKTAIGLPVHSFKNVTIMALIRKGLLSGFRTKEGEIELVLEEWVNETRTGFSTKLPRIDRLDGVDAGVSSGG